jgi:hypothetical protein
MIGKRWLAMGVLAAGICVPAHVARAEDPAPRKDDAPASPEDAPKDTPKPAPQEAPKKKDPFFGTHFAMYLETRGGPASFDTIKNPVTTGAQLSSENELKFNGSKSGQFTVGWTLPRGRGQYLLTYNGIADGDYELTGTGSQLSYRTTDSAARPLQFPVPWWHVKIEDGALTTTKVPPVWNLATDDANLNTLPDFDEMRYPATEITLNEAVPSDLGNRIQTWDLKYRREFGGVRIHARWEAGIRYLNVEGAILTPTWLTGTSDPPEFGYSDGVVNKFVLLQQTTNGYGPMGSGEVQFNFFRQRLTLYLKAEAAFLVTSLEADSNAFTFFARDTGGTNQPFPGAGRIQRSISKTAWNTTFEAGVRVKILEGFHAILDWNTTGYLDSFLIPTSISIPVNASEAPLGTTARFVSRDFVISTINVGLSFQF